MRTTNGEVTVTANDDIAAWAGEQRLKFVWRSGTSIGWKRVDGKRAIERDGAPVIEGNDEWTDELWAVGEFPPIPTAEEVFHEDPARTCANWSAGCDGETSGAMHGRLTYCPEGADWEATDWAVFVGDGVLRPATRAEREALEAEGARVFRCGRTDVNIGRSVAKVNGAVFGEVLRAGDGVRIGLIGVEP